MRCAHWHRLPLYLAREARGKSASGCLDSSLQCQLSAHESGEHYGFVDDPEYGTAWWLRWCGTEVDLVVLPDCPVVGPGPDGEGCCLFADHAEQHTWEEARPVEEVPCIS
ncbi:hypothetical protein IPZ61_17605 [Streptomyces sioyaensis]|uniref:hypothetical protein n=1 Tax=Streptomyces sioyaensis TaxID=67364 RepID=UPI001F21FC95|nr:hypothetical protein [Streptomyces sioyaensis]MCF3175127.1 hypothetical protein [Streptomyces sioyaensis]